MKLRARNSVAQPLNWEAIECVAKALLQHQTLDGKGFDDALAACFPELAKFGRAIRSRPDPQVQPPSSVAQG